MTAKKQAVLSNVNARGKSPKPPTPRKAQRLIAAALKLVDDNACEIARSLYESTLAGHVLSAKLLIDLAEGNADVEDAINKRPLRTLAMDLAAEPEWEGDSLESQAEQARANRKTEAA